MLFSDNGFSCVSCSFECFTEHDAMNSDSQTVISIGVSRFSSLRSWSTNELVNILAANPMILFSSKDIDQLVGTPRSQRGELGYPNANDSLRVTVYGVMLGETFEAAADTAEAVSGEQHRVHRAAVKPSEVSSAVS